MTPASAPLDDGDSTPVTVAIVDDDGGWAERVVRGLETADGGIEATAYTDAASVLETIDDLDCVVAGPALDPAAIEELCRRASGEHGTTAVVAVVGPESEPGAITDRSTRPTAVHVGPTDDSRPVALAWRIRNAVRTARLAGRLRSARSRLRALVTELPTPLAITDADGTVERTNPAFKAAFGLGETLPPSLPDSPADGRADVECETLDGERPFRYVAVELDDGRVCHAFREQMAAPGPETDPGATTGPGPPDDEPDRPSPLEGLTDRQREVLEVAHEGGFFDRPKAHNSEELAASLGINRSTFLQHLRAAQRKLLDEVLE